MVDERLATAGFACEICEDLDGLICAIKSGAGAVVIAQEALKTGDAERLLIVLEEQEPWSDVPVIVLTLATSERSWFAHPAMPLLERANVMILQRPMSQHLLLSAVRSAVRARRRQYQMRDLHQELSRAVQLGDMFVSILGHDLRTPLGAIKMAAELIVRTAEDTRCLRPAGRILRSADRMTRMIKQLLDFAKARQGGGFRLQPVAANFFDITRQVVQELGDANPLASINLASAGTLSGHWDPDRLGQVVSNLVGNAVQHGTVGSPITVELDGTATAQLVLRVENFGVIPVEAIPNLFEPFKRRAPAQGNERGLGLGLFIAREIVRAHGGELAVRTSETTTVFEAFLPREARPTQTQVLASR